MKPRELRDDLLRRVEERLGTMDDQEAMEGHRDLARMLPVELERYAPLLGCLGVMNVEVETAYGVWSFRLSLAQWNKKWSVRPPREAPKLSTASRHHRGVQ